MIKSSIKKKIFVILSLFAVLILVRCIGVSGVNWGKVIDKNTGEPVEGAIFVRSWDTVGASPAG